MTQTQVLANAKCLSRRTGRREKTNQGLKASLTDACSVLVDKSRSALAAETPELVDASFLLDGANGRRKQALVQVWRRKQYMFNNYLTFAEGGPSLKMQRFGLFLGG